MSVTHYERQVPSHGNPVNVSSLAEGATYFVVTFIDPEMLVPDFHTVVYIGANLDSEDTDQLYFQDISSYVRGVRYDSNDVDEYAVFDKVSGSELDHIFTFDGAVDALLRCAMRRSARELNE